jgi:hypothetical protein
MRLFFPIVATMVLTSASGMHPEILVSETLLRDVEYILARVRVMQIETSIADAVAHNLGGNVSRETINQALAILRERAFEKAVARLTPLIRIAHERAINQDASDGELDAILEVLETTWNKELRNFESNHFASFQYQPGYQHLYNQYMAASNALYARTHSVARLRNAYIN